MMNTSILSLIALICAADAWKVKIAGAFGDAPCSISSVGSVWQVAFPAGSNTYVLGSFSQKPTSCVAQKLNDDLVFSYIVSGTDNGELRVRIPNLCESEVVPVKATTCGETTVLVDTGVVLSGSPQAKSCGVPAGKCGYADANYCELYTCSGPAEACSSSLIMAAFSFDIALTPNSKCAMAGGQLSDDTSILAVGTPKGTEGTMTSCCNVDGKTSNDGGAVTVSALVGVMAIAMTFV
jgi:hypothetical protein